LTAARIFENRTISRNFDIANGIAMTKSKNTSNVKTFFYSSIYYSSWIIIILDLVILIPILIGNIPLFVGAGEGIPLSGVIMVPFPIILVPFVVIVLWFRRLKRRQQQRELDELHAATPSTAHFEGSDPLVPGVPVQNRTGLRFFVLRTAIASSTFIVLFAIGIGFYIAIFGIWEYQIDKAADEKVRQWVDEAPDKHVCKQAIENFSWTQFWASQKWVDEARERGLSLEDCEKLFKAKETIRGSAFGRAEDDQVCWLATQFGRWSHREDLQNWVAEARDRGLTLEDCEKILKAN
jgi:hypothetical protein